jgi:hypothetical protein
MLVQHGASQHAAANPGANQYSGMGAGVTYAQQMPEGAQVGLTYNAHQDMDAAAPGDGVANKRLPGAMGSLSIPGAVKPAGSTSAPGANGEDPSDVRRGYQMYLGSSLKGKSNANKRATATLEPGLQDTLTQTNGGSLAAHRNKYNCTEPATLSEHGYANSWDPSGSSQGGRVYVDQSDGTTLPPCGEDGQYGCRDVVSALGGSDIKPGQSSGTQQAGPSSQTQQQPQPQQPAETGQEEEAGGEEEGHEEGQEGEGEGEEEGQEEGEGEEDGDWGEEGGEGEGYGEEGEGEGEEGQDDGQWGEEGGEGEEG